MIPSGKLTKLWKITTFNGKIHYKWQFSIAMLNYQRVNPNFLSHEIPIVTSHQKPIVAGQIHMFAAKIPMMVQQCE
jgi:hypothetical protein